MARLTSLLPRDEYASVSTTKPNALRRSGPGSAALISNSSDRIGLSPATGKRLSNVHDASYVMALSDDRERGIQPGRAYRFRKTRRVSFCSANSPSMNSRPTRMRRLLMMRIPAAELRGRLVSIEDHVSRRFKPNEQMTRLLVGMIRSIAELFINSPPPNPQALATEIISFVALTIGSEDRGAATDVRNARYHLRRRIVDFIESHLSDQSLSPKKIAASSRISLSYLYSLFNDNETTVSQFVQTKRLQRAYEILVADPKGHRTVSEVAYEVGFKNVSHFSRCFSRHFNVAPRDVRQTHNASPQPNTDARPASPKGLRAPRVPSPSRGSLASPGWQRRPLHETV